MNAVEELDTFVEKFELFTGHKSLRNIVFYEKLGFQQSGIEEVNPKLSLIFMEKLISEKTK